MPKPDTYIHIHTHTHTHTHTQRKASEFMSWKNQYCQNVHTTQSSLQIQYTLYHNMNNILQRTKLFMELQKIWIVKSWAKENRPGGITLSDFKIYCKAIRI
jgi:hypothetical protein